MRPVLQMLNDPRVEMKKTRVYVTTDKKKKKKNNSGTGSFFTQVDPLFHSRSIFTGIRIRSATHDLHSD